MGDGPPLRNWDKTRLFFIAAGEYVSDAWKWLRKLATSSQLARKRWTPTTIGAFALLTGLSIDLIPKQGWGWWWCAGILILALVFYLWSQLISDLLGVELRTAVDQADAGQYALKELRTSMETTLQALLKSSFLTARVANDSRITAYGFDGDKNLTMVARYCPRPDRTGSSGGRFDVQSGLVGRAFREGTCEVLDLPDPIADPERYIEAQQSHGLDSKTAAELSMKARSYAGRQLLFEGDIIGVLMFESDSPTGVSLSVVPGNAKTLAHAALTIMLSATKEETEQDVRELEEG